ncbi:uncharacterized protein [Tiliqua scincoides]|uniref:uncharacterized protein isoform X2 n=1 Tax=Tiliqua scincoides TaxID=71010 RepID=UPI003461F63C
MEAQVFYKGEILPYSTHVKTEDSSETSEKTNYETKEEIFYHFHGSSFGSSLMSHSETSLEFTKVTGRNSADEQLEENQLDEELLYSSNYFAIGNSTLLPSQVLCRQISDKKQYRTQESVLLNHKTNTITYSDLIFSSYPTKFETGGMTNIEVSSSEDQEEDNEKDTFTELPMSGTVLENLHKMYIAQTKQDRYGYISPILSGNDLNEKKLKDGNMHLRLKLCNAFSEDETVLFKGTCQVSTLMFITDIPSIN